MTPLAVLCDFDGTIAEIDTAVTVFNKFIDGDWKIFNERLDRKEITLEECMREQFKMIKASKSEILSELDLDVPFRPGYRELVDYCKVNHVPFEIISAGLGFVIKHLLKARGLNKNKVHAAETIHTENGLEMKPLELFNEDSIDFKEDLVSHMKTKGHTVLYIGDGMSDKGAVMSADFCFVVKGSRLAEFCKVEEINHIEIEDFYEVIPEIEKRIK